MSKLVQSAASTRKRVRNGTDEQITSTEAPKTISKTIGVISDKLQAEGSEPKAPIVMREKAVPCENVIYVGHIPHGFYEMEMKTFFNQFGRVKQVKVCRNPKTERSRGYGFIQFEDAAVATVVAEAMDGYFIHERQLVCRIVPLAKIHIGLFKIPRKKDKTEAEESKVEATAEEIEEQLQKSFETHTKRLRSKQQKLAALGINFEIFGTNSAAASI